MSDDERSPGILYYIIMFLFIGAMLVVMWFVFAALPSAQQINPVSNTTKNQYTFSGELGMVTYNHGWFGIGTTGTVLSFQNGTEILTFTFDKDLPVQMGKNYTVTYQVETITYYGVDNSKLFSSWYQNRTIITPEKIILAGLE